MDDRRRRFEAQVLPHLDAAYRFARWLTRTSEGADDVVQEAILRAYRGFDGFRGSHAKAWLLTIVRNCHATALKQQQRRAQAPLPEEHDLQDAESLIATTPDPESASIRQDEERTLERLVAGLRTAPEFCRVRPTQRARSRQLRSALSWCSVAKSNQIRRTSVATTNDKPPANGNTGSASQIQGEGDYKAARKYDTDTRNFIETHDVTKLARKAAPGSGEEAADLLQAEEVGRSHASGDKPSKQPKDNTGEKPDSSSKSSS